MTGLYFLTIKYSNDYTAPSSLSAAAEGKRIFSDESKSMNEEKRASRAISSGGWKCRNCGRINQYYTGTCSCGVLKSSNNALTETRIEQEAQPETKKISDNEMENLQKLKVYKELLDSGVITQEDFDKKKAQLLNL